MLCAVLVCLALVSVGSCASWNNDFDVIPSAVGTPTLTTNTVYVQERDKDFNLSVYIAVMKGDSTAFSYISNGCANHTVLSVMAKENKCTYATNGGFFGFTPPSCEGNVIIKQQVLSFTDDLVPSFGVVSYGKSYAIGYINQSAVASAGFDYLLSGHGWLVRNGLSYLATSAKTEPLSSDFIAEKAPRTAVGIDPAGNLYLIEVDGQENIYKGMGLEEYTDFLLSLGLWSVINIDGGGSSESYYMGKVINTPTCVDNSTVCERPLGSGTCITI